MITNTTLSNLLIASIDIENANCDGQNGSIELFILDGVAPYTYILTNSSGVSTSYNENPINNLSSDTYFISVSDSNGCTDTSSFEIEQPSQGVLEITPSFSVITLGDSIPFNANPSIGNFEWNPPVNLSCDTCANPTAYPEFDITYIITLDDGTGCLLRDTVTVQVNQPEIYVPSAFTPNGDGENDFLHVMDKNIGEFISLRIFNRWGNLLFETNDITQGWDGHFKGEPQEVDTYIYDLEIVLPTGQSANVNGHVLLLK